MSVKVTKTHLKEMVREAIQEVLLEARSLSTIYKNQFSTIVKKIKNLTQKVIELEKMHKENRLDHAFLGLSTQVFKEIFGHPEDKLRMEDLEAFKLESSLPLYYYVLKLRSEMIENSEEPPDNGDNNQMTFRNKVFYSDEYDVLSNIAFSLSQALVHLENFNDNTSKHYFEQLGPFFQRYKETQNSFLKFYIEHKPRFEVHLEDEEREQTPRHTGRHAGARETGNTNLRQSHEKMKYFPPGY
jgi:hypothetical protein